MVSSVIQSVSKSADRRESRDYYKLDVNHLTCSACKSLKPTYAFNVKWCNQSSRVVYSSVCKACHNRSQYRLTPLRNTNEYKTDLKQRIYVKWYKYKLTSIKLGKRSDLKIRALYDLAEKATHCYYCGEEFVKDHKAITMRDPFTRGGEATEENIAVVCRFCCTRKKDKTDTEFKEYLEVVS